MFLCEALKKSKIIKRKNWNSWYIPRIGTDEKYGIKYLYLENFNDNEEFKSLNYDDYLFDDWEIKE